jgi:hypothetical protein
LAAGKELGYCCGVKIIRQARHNIPMVRNARTAGFLIRNRTFCVGKLGKGFGEIAVSTSSKRFPRVYFGQAGA